jgi:prepilin peptidase CpaA
MPLTPAQIVLVVVLAAFTAAAVVWDTRYRRIPNKLTIPMFFAGWVYQAVFHQWSGLADGALGFLVGFGVLFALWFIGGGGGGDVKLMGALSVWLGYRMTLMVLIVSTVLILFGTVCVVVYSLATRGIKGSQQKYLATKKQRRQEARKSRRIGAETVEQKQERRIMTYALPVTLATWLVVTWQLVKLHQKVEHQETAAATAAHQI